MGDLESAKLANGPDTFWVRDWLPDDLPSARLLLFNYDSTAYNDAPQVKLKDLAMELQVAFQHADWRTLPEERTRPIIFVCHSYGGLVVKQALVQAILQPERNRDILGNTYGLIFLGTPHLGSHYSLWAKTVARLLRPIGSNPDIYLEVEVNATATSELHADFITTFSDLQMANFYENRETQFSTRPSIKGMIVEPFSATFEAPNTKNYMMNSDHSGLNKPNSRSDEGYKKILQTLRLMIGGIQRKQRPGLNHSDIGPNTAEMAEEKPVVLVDIRMTHSFTERSNLSHQIAEYMDTNSSDGDPHRSLALWGLGGCGKSQLALRYLETHKDNYNPIIWVDARTPETARAAFWTVFLKAGLPWPSQEMDQLRKGMNPPTRSTNLRDDSFVMAVLNWLESRRDASKRWLFVLDNADDLTSVRDLLPRGKMGSVIVTSRDREVRNIVDQAIEVQNMSEDEGLELLLKSAGVSLLSSNSSFAGKDPGYEQILDALDIVNRVGRLALAIDLAGAYIGQHDGYQEDFKLYLEDLKRDSVEILAKGPTVKLDNYSDTVITVWETSFNAVEKINPLSAQLLNLFAFFDRTHLEDRLFLAASMGSFLRKTTLESIVLDTIWIMVCAFFWLSLLPVITGFILLLWGREWRPGPSCIRIHNQNALYFAFGHGLLYLLCLGFFCWELTQVEQTMRMNPDKLSAKISIHQELPLFVLLGACCSASIVKIWISQGDPIDETSLTFNGLVLSSSFTTEPPSVTETLDQLLRDLEDTTPAKVFLYPIACEVGFMLSSTCFYALLFGVLEGLCWVIVKVWDCLSKENITNTGKRMERLMFLKEDIVQFNDIESRLSKISPGCDFFSSEMLYSLSIAGAPVISSIYVVSIGVLLVRSVYNFTQHDSNRVSLSKLRWLELFFLGILSGYIGYLTGSWLFSATTPEQIISGRSGTTFLVESLTATYDDNKWNSQLYSEAYSVLSRFNLVQRTESKGFAMHALVQGWARHRLALEDREVWVREGTKLFEAILHYEEVWHDLDFQARLVPHLLELLRAHLQNWPRPDQTTYDLLMLLNACLRRVELVQQRQST